MIVLLALMLVFDLCAISSAGEQKLLAETIEMAQMRKRYAEKEMQLVDQRRSDVAEWFALKTHPEYSAMSKEGRRVSNEAFRIACQRCFRELKESFPKESLEDLAKVLMPSTTTIEKDLMEIRVLLAENGMSFVLYEMEVRESLWISCVEMVQSIRWCCGMMCGPCRRQE